MAYSLEDWKNLFSIFGVVVAAGALGKAVYEYTRQVAERRAQQFLVLRSTYTANPEFQRIISHLYGDADFSSIPLTDRIQFMAFFEDIAFLVNSGLVRAEVASYMFGGDAIKAWTDDQFWPNDIREDPHWSLLRDFVQQMTALEERLPYASGQVKL